MFEDPVEGVEYAGEGVEYAYAEGVDDDDS